jgi:predicted  nucleic acid-binding Zn-ribbon protein
LNSLYNTELFQGTGKHLKPISPDLIRPILSKQIASIESGIKSLKHNLDHCSAASELDQLIIEKGTANFRQELPNFEDKFVKLKTLSLEISSPKKIRGKQLSNIYQEINALAESLSSDLAFLHRDSIAESTQVGGIEKIGLF